MFSKKLDYYEKPCKWLLALLNLIFPLMVLGSIYDIVIMAAGWETFAPVRFVQDLIFAVCFLIIDLLARFLDRTAFISLVAGHCIAVASDIVSVVVVIAKIREAAGALNSIDTGILGNVVGMASGMMVAGQIIGALVALVIYIASLAYIISRKDLFLTSEAKMKAEHDFDDLG